MRRKGIEPMHDEHVNVTPLIDVIMCLIIFFMCCTTLVKSEANDQVQIPRAKLGQEMPEQRGRLMINLLPRKAADGSVNAGDEPDVIIRGQPVAMQDLTAYLRKEKQESPDLKVILRADEALTYQWISPVLISCVQANITSVNFSTRDK